jgi:hypothetical protein
MMMMKDSIKILLSFLLLLSVLTGKKQVNNEQYNVLVTTMLMLFTAACFYDIIIALILVSLAFVLLSKVIVKESFDAKINDTDKNKVQKEKEIREKDVTQKTKALKEKKTTAPKETEKAFKTPALPKVESVKLPSHCDDFKDLDEEFLKEYDINKKKLNDIQNNVFDKYNYDVYYNEMGEGSLDIQGVFNHEVIGYEH